MAFTDFKSIAQVQKEYTLIFLETNLGFQNFTHL